MGFLEHKNFEEACASALRVAIKSLNIEPYTPTCLIERSGRGQVGREEKERKIKCE